MTARALIQALDVPWQFWEEIHGSSLEAAKDPRLRREIRERLPYLTDEDKEAVRAFAQALLEETKG